MANSPFSRLKMIVVLGGLWLVSGCSSVPFFDLGQLPRFEPVSIGLESFMLGDDSLDVENGFGVAQSAALEMAKANGLAYAGSHGLYIEKQNVATRCFGPKLQRLLRTIENKFDAPIIVTSGYRSPSQNRRAGGSRKSKHINCEAADIYLPGVKKSEVIAFARTLGDTGGIGCYPGRKFFHIDVRERIKGYHHRPMYFRGCPKSWHTKKRKDGWLF